MMITKDISKLQPDYFKKLYGLRSESEWNVPYEEYIFRFVFVVADGIIYYRDDECTRQKLVVFANHQDFRTTWLYMPSVIIEDNRVIKNRYGYTDK